MTIAANTTAPRASTDWAVVTTMAAAGVVAVMQLGKPSPALPMIRDDLGIDLVTAGWVSSIINLFGALAGGIAGFLTDRIGHRRTVVGALGFLVIGALGVATADSASFLLSARFLEGLGLVAMFVAGTPLIIGAATTQDRTIVLGIWSAFFPIGLGLIVVASAGFLTTVGWRGFFAANTALCVVMLIVFLTIVRPTRVTVTTPSTLQGTRAALLRGGPWFLSLIFLVMSISTFAVQTWLPTFLLDQLDLPIETVALASGAFIFLFIPANILGSRASGSGTFKRWHVLAVGSIGIALVPFGIFADGLNDLARAAIACLYPLSAGLIPGAVFSGIPVHTTTRSEIGVVTGLITQGSFVGNLAGPPLLAFLILQLSGWPGAVWMFPVLGALCLAITLAIAHIEARAQKPIDGRANNSLDSK